MHLAREYLIIKPDLTASPNNQLLSSWLTSEHLDVNRAIPRMSSWNALPLHARSTLSVIFRPLKCSITHLDIEDDPLTTLKQISPSQRKVTSKQRSNRSGSKIKVSINVFLDRLAVKGT